MIRAVSKIDPNPKPTYLIISQVYVPDPASVGQHVADAAAELARRGWRVVVFASANGYDDPSKKYPKREVLNGVEVRRLPFSSFGKGSIAVRLIAQWLFIKQAVFHAMFVKNVRAIMVSTSPPFCGAAGAFLSRLKGVPVKYWLMDLNPDQMIAMGKIGPKSFPARVFDFFNRMILRRASDVVVLDRFMLDRVNKKVDVTEKSHVMPPWPHEDGTVDLPHEENDFRRDQALGGPYLPAEGGSGALPGSGRFVIMYSGNHSPANPIATVLDAAERFRDDDRVVFMFIGGGGGKKEVEDRLAKQRADGKRVNIVSLPYQPLERIRYSLSAADVHVVSVGDDVVGIVHPCKVYGAMAMTRPVLLLGPSPSHVSDLIENHGIGWHVSHGDVEGAVRVIREMLATPSERLRAMGQRAAKLIEGDLSKRSLMGRYIDVMEHGVSR